MIGADAAIPLDNVGIGIGSEKIYITRVKISEKEKKWVQGLYKREILCYINAVTLKRGRIC